ncbi:MAG TPA: ribulokinase, partial [Planctomycetota bacterium]|nr:ribulokinase [Planctomycetota bacterium]
TDICEAQQRMTGRKPHVHRPRPETSAAYARLFELYRTLHDAFARGNGRIDLSGVMKELLDLQARARRAPRVS